MQVTDCERRPGVRAWLWVTIGVAGLCWGRPCLAEVALPGATAPLREIAGDVHIRDQVQWRDASYRVTGSITLHEGGTLLIENAQVEVAGEYSRHYNWRWDGGKLVTRNATVGGSLRDGRVRQVNMELQLTASGKPPTRRSSTAMASPSVTARRWASCGRGG